MSWQADVLEVRRPSPEVPGIYSRLAPVYEVWARLTESRARRRVMELAAPGPAEDVLEVAAGTGAQLAELARRNRGGRTVGVELSEGMLRTARRRIGSTGAELLQGDALDLPFGDDSFDLVVNGYMLDLLPREDIPRALAEMRRVLVPGGRISVAVYSTPERNRFFSIPVSIIRRHAELPPPSPAQPGPFSLGEPGVLEATLRAAGFTEVEVRAVPSPLRLPSAAECVRFERESFGALHQMLAGLSAERQAAVWEEIEAELRQFERDGSFEGPCELLVGAGTR